MKHFNFNSIQIQKYPSEGLNEWGNLTLKFFLQWYFLDVFLGKVLATQFLVPELRFLEPKQKLAQVPTPVTPALSQWIERKRRIFRSSQARQNGPYGKKQSCFKQSGKLSQLSRLHIFWHMNTHIQMLDNIHECKARRKRVKMSDRQGWRMKGEKF